ncbi:MAG: polyketide cyclase / dehydrase and lipid transport [Haloquadratum walsbyi J07HQW1]|jgi:uncharacterized membrane protein|uniref:Polyketide cyclase / dehydrase and lipid transport n=1 Tax=Haloquadratum walsbyi J07HQW1 TaxID=1238424 RepID=U1ML81_9EURY|nr:MAG: polyketide cyclase / dehydrase and lipid transport [Haloquadratum walsbyi J07HQW1]
MTQTDVTETTRIDAPVTVVFEYLDDPRNQPEFTPSLTRSEPVEELSNGGKRVAYTYSMAGIDLTGEITATKYEPESAIHWEMDGDITGEIKWTFEAEEDTTIFSYTAQYDIPVPVLDSVVKPFAERYNERELKTALENLRTRIEAEVGSTSGSTQ